MPTDTGAEWPWTGRGDDDSAGEVAIQRHVPENGGRGAGRFLPAFAPLLFVLATIGLIGSPPIALGTVVNGLTHDSVSDIRRVAGCGTRERDAQNTRVWMVFGSTPLCRRSKAR